MKLVSLRCRRTALAIAGFLPCTVLAVLWARSYWRWDSISLFRAHGEIECRSASGTVAIQRNKDGMPPQLRGTIFWSQPTPQPMVWSKVPPGVIGLINDDMLFWDRFWWWPRKTSVGCFAMYTPQPTLGAGYHWSPPPGCWAIESPYWFWLGLSAVLPLRRLRTAVRARSLTRSGRCGSSGYDLRATPPALPGMRQVAATKDSPSAEAGRPR